MTKDQPQPQPQQASTPAPPAPKKKKQVQTTVRFVLVALDGKTPDVEMTPDRKVRPSGVPGALLREYCRGGIPSGFGLGAIAVNIKDNTSEPIGLLAVDANRALDFLPGAHPEWLSPVAFPRTVQVGKCWNGHGFAGTQGK